MKDYITKHKDMREFFSYNVPFNMIGDAIDFDLIEQIVLKCFQLTNLHNSMLAKCSGFLNVTEENIPWIKILLCRYLMGEQERMVKCWKILQRNTTYRNA